MTESYYIKEHRNITDAAQLPPDERDGIERCVTTGFGGGVTAADALRHSLGDQVLVAHAAKTGEVAGFSSTSIISPRRQFPDSDLVDIQAGYLAGAAVGADHQANGLYGELFGHRFDYIIKHQGVDMVYTRTQNPLVLRGITKGLERMVRQRRARRVVLARVVLMPSAYSGQLMPNMPEVFDDIDTRAGDAKVFMWEIER